MDYANLEFQTLDLQHQHHKCKSHKRTLFSHKEILLVFALIGAFNIPRTGCDDTENFQKNSKYLYSNICDLQIDNHLLSVCHSSKSKLPAGFEQILLDYISFKSDFYLAAAKS